MGAEVNRDLSLLKATWSSGGQEKGVLVDVNLVRGAVTLL